MNQKILYIIIHGDGSQTRCFCHVSDVANAFTLALERAEGEIINVGNVFIFNER